MTNNQTTGEHWVITLWSGDIYALKFKSSKRPVLHNNGAVIFNNEEGNEVILTGTISVVQERP